MTREMTPKERLVYGHVLDPDRAGVRENLHHAVDH
jgi:hypothetical protein